MTSFSAYASRFLATGAGAGPAPQSSSSMAFNNSLYRPFGGTGQGRTRGTERGLAGVYGHDDEDDDGIDDEQAEEEAQLGYSEELRSASKGKQRQHLPHLQAKSSTLDKQKGASSRMLSHFRTANHVTSSRSSSPIADINDEDGDEDEVDDEVEGRRLHSHGRRHSALHPVSGSSYLDDQQGSTPSASFAPHHRRDDQDPFLAEDDLQRNMRTPSASPHKTRRSTVERGKARGWMVHHGTESSSSSLTSADVDKDAMAQTPRVRESTLPNDIYRDPDEDSRDEEEQQHRRTSGRSNAYSIYDEDDGSSQSTVSDFSEDERRRGRRTSRRGTVAKAAGSIGSSLREPLLSSAGSEIMDGSTRGGQQPPGAFRGATSRISSSDIYSYPHPPAKAGWTPWAPGNRVPLRQYKDKAALLAWLGAAAGTLLVAGWMSLSAHSVSPPSSPSTRPSPYYTLTRSIPILFLLTFLSVGAAIANLVFLRNIQRVGGGHILRYGLIGVPVILGAGWVWAFAGSFIYDDERWSGGGWSTTGLRVLSLVPLLAAAFFARSVWKRRDALSRSLSVLELSAQVVATHPSLLVLSLTILAAFLIVTAPFLSIFVRLFLRGHFGAPGSGSKVWQTDATARLVAWLTLGVWLWTWLVLRGVQRVTIAGVVSHWYFHRVDDDNSKVFDQHDIDDGIDETLPGPAPGQWLGEEQMDANGMPSHLTIVRASFVRATGPALGTICISALVLSVARVATMIAATARWAHRKLSASSRIPVILQPMTHVVALLAGIGALMQGLSDYALIYVGVTGDGFAPAARRSSRLVSRQNVKTVMEGLVINTLLDLTTLALCFLTGLAGFLFSAHNLHVPADAPLVGLLCALLPYWTLRLCADVLTNAADTLYLCFSIDEASGEQHCKEAAEAFTKGSERLPF